MSGASFSLTEKLAVTGAFLALVALAVGTEDDPGLVVTGQEAVTELRPAAPPPAASPAPPASETPPSSPSLAEPATPPAALKPPTEVEDGAGQFDPELGRVPLDFSKGPPPG
ncbi:MAG TPA: hypothetical protein VFS87_04600 [Qipengyuania sp.]|nr:hypothetical protein [Qipengyuania sp.]